MPLPPMPAIFMGVMLFIEGMLGICGSATWVLTAVVVMRFICAGALMVFCFCAICTLCSMACRLGLLEGGAPTKSAFLRVMIVCTTK